MPANSPDTNTAKAAPLRDEADIGSGERTPAQHDTDEMIKQIPPLPPSSDNTSGAGAGQPQQPDRTSKDNPGAAGAPPTP